MNATTDDNQPLSPDAMLATEFFNSGNACYGAGRFAEAADFYRRTLAIAPGHAESHNNLGAALSDLGQAEEAVACYLRALRLLPDYPEAQFNLGNAFQQLRMYPEAEANYRRAVRACPDRPPFHHNLGQSLAKQGKLDEAETSYRKALQYARVYPDALTALGLVLAEQGRFDEALAAHDQALEHREGFAEAHRNRALVHLLLGNFQQGWADYEWRWRCADFAPLECPQPRWDGAELNGRTILLYAEQGIGDTLQYVRFAPLVQQRGGRVVLAVRAALIPLLERCQGIDRFVALGSFVSDFDVHCPLLSLPYTLGLSAETIPRETPYIFPDPELVEFWRRELARFDGLKVGVCWQRNPNNEYYRDDRIPLRHFEPLAKIEGVHLISLQQQADRAELEQVSFPLIDWPDRRDVQHGAFMDSAAIIANLDLVVTLDTAIAHLAGALAARVWLALPTVPESRWLLNRNDSLWYPTARLFRQQTAGDWTQPFAQMAEMLKVIARDVG